MVISTVGRPIKYQYFASTLYKCIINEKVNQQYLINYENNFDFWRNGRVWNVDTFTSVASTAYKCFAALTFYNVFSNMFSDFCLAKLYIFILSQVMNVLPVITRTKYSFPKPRCPMILEKLGLKTQRKQHLQQLSVE